MGGGGAGGNTAKVPSRNPEPPPTQQPTQQPVQQPDNTPDNTPEPVQQPVQQPVNKHQVTRRYGKLDIINGTRGLETLNIKDTEGMAFSILGNERVNRGYTNFFCHGGSRCEVQILRIGDRFDITSEGNVTAKFDIDRYMADVTYDAIKFVDSEKVYDWSCSHTDDTGSIQDNGRTFSQTLSFSKNIETRHGWAGRKYVSTDADGKIYEAYFYVDNPVPPYSDYGYWAIKDSTGNLERTKAPLNKSKSPTIRLSLPLSLQGSPKLMSVPRRLVQSFPKSFTGFGGHRELPNNMQTLTGSATYIGDAVGYFAIKGSSPSSGSFNATATLEANFDTNKIKGTIDNFNMPSISSSSIELKETSFDVSGVSKGNFGVSNGTSTNTETVWTIDGVEGDSRGRWDGKMFRTHSTGVPRDIVGTFYSEYSGANAVITGAFGAEKK